VIPRFVIGVRQLPTFVKRRRASQISLKRTPSVAALADEEPVRTNDSNSALCGAPHKADYQTSAPAMASTPQFTQPTPSSLILFYLPLVRLSQHLSPAPSFAPTLSASVPSDISRRPLLCPRLASLNSRSGKRDNYPDAGGSRRLSGKVPTAYDQGGHGDLDHQRPDERLRYTGALKNMAPAARLQRLGQFQIAGTSLAWCRTRAIVIPSSSTK